MTALLKLHAEMWTFTVVPEGQITAYPTEKNRLSYHYIRIYKDMQNFERDFGDYAEFTEIKKMWEGK